MKTRLLRSVSLIFALAVLGFMAVSARHAGTANAADNSGDQQQNSSNQQQNYGGEQQKSGGCCS